jgi:two-component system heavy metal sensor histidine kinase CusS
MKRRRTLAATLALAFAATTLAVLAVVGGVLYVAFDKQLRTNDDTDIVLIARHLRRLTQELADAQDVRAHAGRLVTQVLGDRALSLQVFDANGNVLVAHNALPATGNVPEAMAREGRWPESVKPDERITESAVMAWRLSETDPMRGAVAQVRLGDGEMVSVLVARHMRDRMTLLDRYRIWLLVAGISTGLLAFLMGYLLIRESLKPLREIARRAAQVTSNQLDTRIELIDAPEELDILQHALNAMLGRLDKGFERMSQYTTDLAHDLRTPLSNLRGQTEVALSRARSRDEYEAALASNLEECERLETMIANVLFLARTENPEFLMQTQAFDAADELRRVAAYFEGPADEAGIAIEVSGSAHVHADADLFRRAIGNLLANAVRYTPRGGTIRLDARTRDDTVEVTVDNDGESIAADLLGRVFDRFYRVDPSRASDPRSSGSAGLGLAIVRSIMTRHGGSARAESNADGARFILAFPLTASRRPRPVQ